MILKNRNKRHAICSYSTLAIALTWLPALSGQAAFRGWTTTGQTDVLALMGVEDSGLAFRNVSSRTVTAFAVSFFAANGDTHTHYLDFFDMVRDGMLPGSDYTLRIAPAELLQATNHSLRIEAVIFGDDTSKGSESDSGFVKMKRLGRMLETERVRSILTTQLSGPDPASLRVAVGRLPMSSDEAVSTLDGVVLPGLTVSAINGANQHMLRGFLEGVRNSREEVLRSVGRLAQMPVSGKGGQIEFLSQLRTLYEAISTKHRSYCEHVQNGGEK